MCLDRVALINSNSLIYYTKTLIYYKNLTTSIMPIYILSREQNALHSPHTKKKKELATKKKQ